MADTTQDLKSQNCNGGDNQLINVAHSKNLDLDDGESYPIPDLILTSNPASQTYTGISSVDMVKMALNALRKMQVDILKTESQYMQEVHELEAKFLSMYQKHFEKRKDIVQGNYEPTEDECDTEEDEDEDTLIKKPKLDNELEEKKPVSGIPDFWLTALLHSDMLEMIENHDIPILKHLTDIKVEITNEPMGFQLAFHFSKNEYFTNEVLTKTYEMKNEVDPENPFTFNGPEMLKTSGCEINWNNGKNVTIRVFPKNKHIAQGHIRTTNKIESVPSFFNLFTPPKPLDKLVIGSQPESQMKLLMRDLQIGHYIRDRIIPRAVLYYTGEVDEDDDETDESDSEDSDEYETDESDSEDSDDDESSDEVETPKETVDCKQQ